MRTVKLKSLVGPVSLTVRPEIDTPVGPRHTRYDLVFNFDNDFKCVAPADWWEKVVDMEFGSEPIKYRQAFRVLATE